MKNETMYEHPLAVSSAVLRIDTKIEKMHRLIKNIVLSNDTESIKKNAYIVDKFEQKVFEDFKIIEMQFLGEKEKYKNALDVFIAWKPIRDEVIALIFEGKRQEAANIIKGKDLRHIAKIELALGSLGSLAQNKASEILTEAKYTKKTSLNYVYFIILISFMVCVTLALIITRSITVPIKEFRKATEIIGEGYFDTLVDVQSKDEIGDLAKSFNDMTLNLNKVTASRDMLDAEIEERKKAEESLINYGILFSNINDLAYICDMEGNILFLNAAFEKLSGHKVDDSIGKSFAPFFDEENLQVAMDVYKRTLQGESPEYELTFKDTGIVCEYHNLPLRDPGQNIIGVIGIARDITKQKQAELLLERKSHDLGERVKELNCLYTLSRLIEDQSLSLEDVFKGLINIIPPSWQYPEITCARITIGDEVYMSDTCRESKWTQSSEIRANGEQVGTLEVAYLEEMPESDEGPFMKEERLLIDALAARLGRAIERKKAQDTIKASLEEKEVLLREVHHRVKNNMAVISSLLSLQQSRTQSRESIGILKDFQNRIRTMSLVHETLYSSDDFSEMQLYDYIASLTKNIISSFSDSETYINCKLEIEQVPFDMDRLIPFGLILNEAITNTVKHAFKGVKNPVINIAVTRNEKDFTLKIEDNGTGISEGVDVLKGKSLGGKIIKSLVRQLNGEIQVTSGKDGTSIKITCLI